MATTIDILHRPARVPIDKSAHPVASKLFDYVMVLLSIWFIGGLFLDGWAHTHHQVESFFTPWHAVLYSGFMVNAGALTWVMWRNIRKGYSIWMSVPVGYEMSAVGAVIFGIGGVFDLLWHTLFGIEVNLEALISPSHLILALGIILVAGGPFRAAWRRSDPAKMTLLSILPMLLSMLFTFSVLTFFTFPLHPFVNRFAAGQAAPDGDPELYVMLGLAQILLQSALLMGCLLLMVRRWQLPFGSVTFVMGLNALALCAITVNLRFVPAAVATGLLADSLIYFLKPSLKRPLALRLVAFAVPTVLYL